MMAGDALPQELVEDAENLAEGTKIFSLNVTTAGDPEIAKEVFKVLCQAALDVAHMSVSTTVSSWINEPEDEPVKEAPNYKVPPAVLAGPHSRACGIHPHDHGSGCAMDCPTCAGPH